MAPEDASEVPGRRGRSACSGSASGRGGAAASCFSDIAAPMLNLLLADAAKTTFRRLRFPEILLQFQLLVSSP
jgi:hypothetical protein